MTRTSEAFRSLDQPLEPDGAFADRLFESLAWDLGFRPAERPQLPVVERLFGRIGFAEWRGRFPVPARRERRLAYLVILTTLLVALIAGFGLLAAGLHRWSLVALTGDQIAAESQAIYPQLPAFDMTVSFAGTGVVRYRYDGAHDLRTDVVSGSMPYSSGGPGSYRVETARQEATYDAPNRVWQLAELPAPRPPLFTMFPLNWIPSVPFAPPAPPPSYQCPGWERLADGIVAGREAFHIACPAGDGASAGANFWIDQASLLVTGSGEGIVASTLDVGPGVVDPGVFALSKPAGAVDADHMPASTVLVVGNVAPDWSGQLLAGGTLSTESLRGRPAVVMFWMDSCLPCVSGLVQLGVFARESTDADVVTVAWRPTNKATLEAVVASAGGGFPVVPDDDGSIANLWGISQYPTYVFLDGDGTVADLEVGPIAEADLKVMVAALLSGQPIPTPRASIAPECGCPSPLP